MAHLTVDRGWCSSTLDLFRYVLTPPPTTTKEEKKKKKATAAERSRSLLDEFGSCLMAQVALDFCFARPFERWIAPVAQ